MIDYDLRRVRAVIFDVDGVLSAATVGMDAEGQPLRTLNIKDGYAIQLAVKRGLRIAIMTGGHAENIARRYAYLHVEDIYLHCSMKRERYEAFRQKYALQDDEIAYVGDDIPDYEVMRLVGLPCCPADACPEIRAISRYVSRQAGGHGVARDVIEQVLKAQDKWMGDDCAFGW